MSFRFLPEAEEELRLAALHYEGERPGLGLRFLTSVYSKIGKIVRSPEQHAPFRLRGIEIVFRQAIVRPFAYTVVYYVEEGAVIITAIAHSKRRPRYWKERLR
jgi:toxin ParE1/3/4